MQTGNSEIFIIPVILLLGQSIMQATIFLQICFQETSVAHFMKFETSFSKYKFCRLE